MPTTASEYHVTSLVLHCQPPHIEQVCAQLNQLEGADIHAISPEGKMILTLESDSQRHLLSQVEQLQHLEGVLSNSLVYHHVDTF